MPLMAGCCNTPPVPSCHCLSLVVVILVHMAADLALEYVFPVKTHRADSADLEENYRGRLSNLLDLRVVERKDC